MSSNVIFMLSTVLLASLIGCSKAPEAYNPPPQPVAPFIPNQAIPTDEDLGKALHIDVAGKPVPVLDVISKPISTEDVEGGFAFDAKIKANSSRPIVYKEGAGGVTFDTTLADVEGSEDSDGILTKPRSGPDVEGYAFYDEGLYILWRQDEPRTPVFILVLQNYLGEMAMPSPLKPIGMGFDFEKLGYKVKTKEGAEKIAIDYYRALENKDENYNCISQKSCQINWGDDSKKEFTFEIPGRLIWLISKDRFVLFRMLLQEPRPTLPFDFDILAGKMFVPGQKSFALGQEFSEVETRLTELLEIDPQDIKTSVGVDTFGRLYDGTAFTYQKTKFDRLSVQPQPTDKMSLMQVWGNYPNIISFADKAVIVSETATGVDLRLATAGEIQTLQTSPDRRELPLVIRLGLQSKNVKPFAQKLVALIESELKKIYPQAIIGSRFIGTYQRKVIKDYSAYVIVFDQAKKEGLFIQFGVEEEQGNLTSFTTLKLGGDMNPLDPLVFADIVKPIEKIVGSIPLISSVTEKEMLNADGTPILTSGKLPTFTQLSGLNIGDTVEVSDWDLGRLEATVKISTQARGAFPSIRASYRDRSVVMVAYDGEKEAPQEVAYVNIGSLSTGLGLKLIKEENKIRTYKIVSITSSLNVASVRDLCGQNFTATFGMSSSGFMESLSKVPNCETLAVEDTGGNGRLVSVYFPKDRIRLSFDQEELVSATVYAPNSEVQ
jgi:hypothetical protein